MNRTFCIGLIWISLTVYSCGQNDKQQEKTEEIIDPIEKMPIFSGGQEGLSNFLKAHVDKWKQENKEEIKGKLFIEFVVTETGETEKVKIINDHTFRVILTEGKKHQIRRMCVALFQEVKDLKRTRIMNIELGNLNEGGYRKIEGEELNTFLSALEMPR